MNRRDKRSALPILIFTAFIVVFLSANPAFSASSDDKGPEKLEAEYDHETNPKKRLKLAVELSDERLKEVRKAYDSEDTAKETAELDKYLSAIDRLEGAAKEPGAGKSKDAEIHLRRQMRMLENIKMSASYSERGPLEKAAARVTKLHEQVLYSILNPKK